MTSVFYNMLDTKHAQNKIHVMDTLSHTKQSTQQFRGLCIGFGKRIEFSSIYTSCCTLITCSSLNAMKLVIAGDGKQLMTRHSCRSLPWLPVFLLSYYCVCVVLFSVSLRTCEILQLVAVRLGRYLALWYRVALLRCFHHLSSILFIYCYKPKWARFLNFVLLHYLQSRLRRRVFPRYGASRFHFSVYPPIIIRMRENKMSCQNSDSAKNSSAI